MTEQSSTHNPSSEHSARLLYTLYTALAGEFDIDLPPCRELETGTHLASDSQEEVTAWLNAADERIAVHQLRQFLQTSKLAGQDSLQAALAHHLSKLEHGDSDRDKIDFLLVQFLAVCASSPEQANEASLSFVADMLEPVLGKTEEPVPQSLEPLEDLVNAANACQSLNEVFSSGILEKGRSLKAASGNDYFSAPALVAFARFNFLMRRVFFRLMHQDLNAILDGLRELESQGIEQLDCRSAEFSAEEPVARLRMICQSWKVMFQAEYAFGQPLRMLVDLRGAIDAALGKGTSAVVDAAPENRVSVAEESHSPVAEEDYSPVAEESPSEIHQETAEPPRDIQPEIVAEADAPSESELNLENESQPEPVELHAAESLSLESEAPLAKAAAASASGDAEWAPTHESEASSDDSESEDELLDFEDESPA